MTMKKRHLAALLALLTLAGTALASCGDAAQPATETKDTILLPRLISRSLQIGPS